LAVDGKRHGGTGEAVEEGRATKGVPALFIALMVPLPFIAQTLLEESMARRGLAVMPETLKGVAATGDPE
jgi:hypothetical protein